MEELVRMTEDRDKWRNYVYDVANPRIEDGKEQNRLESAIDTALHMM